MAVICIAGVAAGIGKTAVAEFLLARLAGWHVARVRVADEMTDADTALLADAPHRLLSAAQVGADAEGRRFLAAGAGQTHVLLAQPRGLAEGLRALRALVPANANLLVEGNAYLWARQADLAVMVIGPGPSGKGLARVRASVREIFKKIDIWAWNTRRDPLAEGFFDFPMDLGRMGLGAGISNRADYHHVNPRDQAHAGNGPFAQAVRAALERKRWRAGSDEFLRKAGFDV
jgi:hypothetical protein